VQGRLSVYLFDAYNLDKGAKKPSVMLTRL
jgi:hypothetical protein